jgi:hypothetical protein
MVPLYLRNVCCVLLVIDCSAPQSWVVVKGWIDKDLI